MIDHTSQLRAIRDQGRRGTCIAFAATAAHEHARTLRHGPLSDDLSVEMLFWRCKQLDASTTDGTTFHSARNALRDPGQCDDTHWPYTPIRDLTAPYDPPAAVATANMSRATMIAIAPDAASVSAALAADGTVVGGLQLWDGFYDCDSASIPVPAADIDTTARHVVCLTGLDEDRDTVMIRNSWGTRWGNNGYAWLARSALPDVLLEAWTIDDDLDPDPD